MPRPSAIVRGDIKVIMAWERVEWVPNHGSGVEESRLLAIMVGVGLLGRRGTCCLVQKMSEGAGRDWG